jgi:predicted SprT family Zn-dependent metalloprotease
MNISRFNKDVLQDFFEKVTGKSLTLTMTDNSSTMISFKKRGTKISLRLHKMFYHADMEVLKEVAQFIMDKKKKTPLIAEFISQNKDKIKEPPIQKVILVSQGRNYNLRKIFDALNRQYFNSTIKTSITWGRQGKRTGARKVTLGSYHREKNMIRINPLLDRRVVPLFFVEFIVYHEMLHADMGIGKKAGRRVIHSPEFRKREKLFKYYHEAMVWEVENTNIF